MNPTDPNQPVADPMAPQGGVPVSPVPQAPVAGPTEPVAMPVEPVSAPTEPIATPEPPVVPPMGEPAGGVTGNDQGGMPPVVPPAV
jgi:hypothetical protein